MHKYYFAGSMLYQSEKSKSYEIKRRNLNFVRIQIEPAIWMKTASRLKEM